MIRLGRPLLSAIETAAEAAYPWECCGLLVGAGDARAGFAVSRVVASPNLAETDPKTSFEIDPQVHFDLIRELGDGPARIVGHYHSHPDHDALPSERDRAMAFEPELVWIICAVHGGRAAETRAHVLDPANGRFREIPLLTDG